MKIDLIETGQNSYKLTGIVKNEAGNEENVEEYSNPHWHDYTIEIKCLGLTYNVRIFYQLHDNGLGTPLTYIYYKERLLVEKISQDQLISIYQILFEEGKLDKRIVNLETIHSTHRIDIGIYKFKDKLHRELTTFAVPIHCFTYGFNNKFYVYVELRAFLDLVKNDKINDINFYELRFKKKYHLSLKDSKDIDFIETISTADKIGDLNNDISVLEREISLIEKRQEQIAIDYYKNKYPNIRDKSFVLFDGGVYRIWIDVYKNNDSDNREEKESLESLYNLTVSGVNIGETGENKNRKYLGYNNSFKMICYESEYQELAKKYRLPVKIKKSSLIKLYNNIQQEAARQ